MVYLSSCPLQELVVDSVLDKEPSGSDAVLTLVEEAGSQCRSDSSACITKFGQIVSVSSCSLQKVYQEYLTKYTCSIELLLILSLCSHLSRSKSSKMMRGLLPPSSSETFLRLESAADLMMVWPMGVEPVKPSFRTRGRSATAWPHSRPVPGNTLMTPGGIPALTDNSANFNAVSGQTCA